MLETTKSGYEYVSTNRTDVVAIVSERIGGVSTAMLRFPQVQYFDR